MLVCAVHVRCVLFGLTRWHAWQAPMGGGSAGECDARSWRLPAQRACRHASAPAEVAGCARSAAGPGQCSCSTLCTSAGCLSLALARAMHMLVTAPNAASAPAAELERLHSSAARVRRTGLRSAPVLPLRLTRTTVVCHRRAGALHEHAGPRSSKTMAWQRQPTQHRNAQMQARVISSTGPQMHSRRSSS